MSEKNQKTKPVFKPKFSTPIHSKQSTTDDDRKKDTNEQNKSVQKKKKSVVKKLNTTEEKETSSKETSLTDSQYEDIFASVTARVLARDFLELDDRFAGTSNMEHNEFDKKSHKSKEKKNKRKSEKRKNKKENEIPETVPMVAENAADKENLTPAENFTKAVLHKSPSLTKRQNEITPTVSPLEENENGVLVKKPEPRKKEKKPKTANPGKRKSLEYTNKKIGGPSSTNDVVETLKSPDENKETDGVVENGTWVQCTSCNKWRFLSECQDPSSLPDTWTCFLNSDKTFSKCSAPEEDWETLSQDSYIYTQFTPGSIVWAKMGGYPSWPAMVDIDPDINTFYESFPDGNVSCYHVVFLDDKVSRAWISHRYVEAYRVNDTPIKLPRNSKNHDFARDMEAAKQRALKATKLDISQRLEKYGFKNRFNGKSHWSRDKNATERKQKRKAMAREKKSNKTDDETIRSPNAKTVAFKKPERSIEKETTEIPKDENTTKDSSYVTGSEAEEEEYWDKQNEEERILFGNMVIDESHDRSDEILIVDEGVKNAVKHLTLDTDIFTMDMTNRDQEIKPLDLSQKDKEEQEEPLDLSGKKSDSKSPPIQEEYWLASDKNDPEPLFEDVEMQVEDEALDEEPEQVEWEEFEKMVMME